jgi:hypothetical protein
MPGPTVIFRARSDYASTPASPGQDFSEAPWLDSGLRVAIYKTGPAVYSSTLYEVEDGAEADISGRSSYGDKGSPPSPLTFLAFFMDNHRQITESPCPSVTLPITSGRPFFIYTLNLPSSRSPSAPRIATLTRNSNLQRYYDDLGSLQSTFAPSNGAPATLPALLLPCTATCLAHTHVIPVLFTLG